MVKTYGKSSLGLSDFKSLVVSLFEQVSRSYPQFKWKFELDNLKKGAQYFHGHILAKMDMKTYRISLDYYTPFDNPNFKNVVICIAGIHRTGFDGMRQEFPIGLKSSKDLGNLAKTIFKWVEKELDKISD